MMGICCRTHFRSLFDESHSETWVDIFLAHLLPAFKGLMGRAPPSLERLAGRQVGQAKNGVGELAPGSRPRKPVVEDGGKAEAQHPHARMLCGHALVLLPGYVLPEGLQTLRDISQRR